MIEPAQPRTVGGLREDHLALMRDWRGLPDDGVRAERAKAFRLIVRSAGQDIAKGSERDEAQGIIDYWASAIAGLRGESYPPILQLDDYLGESARMAGASARETFDALESEEERRIARKLFEDLLFRGRGAVERGAPRTRAVLKQTAGNDAFDAVLDRFLATGAIVRLAGDSPDTDRFEASDPALVEDWPALGDWLDAVKAYGDARATLLSQAQLWRRASDDSSYLARGGEIETIDQFRGETDVLDAFIDASKAARHRQRQILRLLAGVAILALAGFIGLSVALYNADGEKVTAEKRADERVKELDLLTAAQPDATAASLAPAVPTRADRAVETGPAGTLWLGSMERPQVGPVTRRGPAVPIAQAKDGDAYRVLADIRLRAGMPGDAYDVKPARLIIPAGTLVIIDGAPRYYERPTGRQYWAAVRVVPRVYIQYTNGEGAAIEPLRAALSAAGFDVPAAERTDNAAGLNEVRYFNTGDRSAADYLLRTLRASSFTTVNEAACRSFADTRLRGRNFVVELWVDLSGRRATSRPSQC